MGWARIRGAPRRLASDGHDLLDPRIDVTARTAWLLRVSRLASPWGATTAERFVDRLAEVGYPDRHGSQVSIWESGRAPLPLGLVGAYERALDRAPGELLGAVGGMQQTERAAVPDRTTGDRADAFRRLSILDELIAADRASGADWIALAQMLTDPRVTPPAESTVRRWCHVLTVEMLRSGHFDYSARWTALSILLSDPLLSVIAEHEIIAAVGEAGVPLARNGWDVLSQSRRPGIAGALIDRLEPGDDERNLGLSFGLATMIGRVELSRDDVLRLTPRLRSLSTEGSSLDEELGFMLAARLGPSFLAAVGHPPPAPWAHRRYLEQPPHFAQYLDAVRSSSGLDHDEMIERLLQEALSEVLVEKRQLAHQLIGASPYRDAVARTALEVATRSGDAYARYAAANLLRQLAPDDRALLVGLLDSPDPTVRANGVIAVGRAGVREGVPALLELTRDSQLRPSALMALGMIGAATGANDSAELRASQWWLRHGGTPTTTPTPIVD